MKSWRAVEESHRRAEHFLLQMVPFRRRQAPCPLRTQTEPCSPRTVGFVVTGRFRAQRGPRFVDPSVLASPERSLPVPAPGRVGARPRISRVARQVAMVRGQRQLRAHDTDLRKPPVKIKTREEGSSVRAVRCSAAGGNVSEEAPCTAGTRDDGAASGAGAT